MIKADSAEAFKVLDSAEKNNMSYFEIACTINNEREKQKDRINFPLVGPSAIASLIKRCDPKKTRIGTRKQGKIDPTSVWSIARLNSFSQFLVRCGYYSTDKDFNELIQTSFGGTCPHWLKRETIKEKNLSIDIKKVVWFDEKHIAQQVGGFGNKRNRLRFIATRLTYKKVR